jgi:hypothetical protein
VLACPVLMTDGRPGFRLSSALPPASVPPRRRTRAYIGRQRAASSDAGRIMVFGMSLDAIVGSDTCGGLSKTRSAATVDNADNDDSADGEKTVLSAALSAALAVLELSDSVAHSTASVEALS